MREALVIAITRMGDLIQSEPFCRALKRRGVDRVVMLVEEAFVPIAESLMGVDEVVSMRFRDILPQLGQSPRNYPVGVLASLINSFRERKFTLVWNLTHTRPAMLLASAIGGECAQGVALDSRGLQIVREDWLKYFFATNLARPWSPFNLVDVYVNSVDEATPFSERIPRIGNAARGVKHTDSLHDLNIALHPGASQNDKQWPIERFHLLANALLDRGANVTLIGGKADQALADGFPKHRDLNNKIGKTSLPDLVSLFTKVDILISADSGPVHVASAIGTKVIAIEGGSAHGWETSPYGTGHWVVQPHLPKVLERVPDKKAASAHAELISANSVLSVIETALGERSAPDVDSGCTIYETSSDGYNLSLLPRAGVNSEIEAWYADLRNFWRAALSHRRIRSEVKNYSKSGEIARTCAILARQISDTLVDSEVKLISVAESLRQCQSALTCELKLHPPLHPVALYLEISLASVEGETVQEQARATSQVFEQIARGTQHMSAREIQTSLNTNHSMLMEESCESI